MRILRGSLAALSALIAVLAGLGVLGATIIAFIFLTEPAGTGGGANIPSLEGKVSVLRDAHGVPHIFADSRHDAYRALGFIHAQDRFFQMEFARRTAAGRLSEIVGPLGLPSDRFMRTLGIYRLAEASVATLSPDARAAVYAYVDGVNAWLNDPETRRPAELIALGITPEPWRAADSAAWVRLMALLLAGDWRTEILKVQLSKTLSPQQIRDLWPDEPEDAPTTMAMAPELRRQLAAIASSTPDIFPEASASNQWGVSGARSASGKPLLANDPHLGLTAPGMWHLARIVTPDFKASGAAIPGQPFFMVGQNGSLAWGLTTTHADTQDLFVERLAPNDPDSYLTPDGSQPFETRIEEIRIRRRSAHEQLKVRTTRHGPVISDIASSAAELAGSESVIALAFAALRDDDRTANAIYGMNSAKTAEEFRAALRDFHAPMQNVAYAHTDGSFGFVAAGRVPIRPGGPGNIPHAGWTGANDWAGFIPFDDLPQLENPGSGVVINANNRIVSQDYPHVIANDWPEGFRAQRIENLLAKTTLHTLDSFAYIQLDVVSLGAQALLEGTIGALGMEADDSEALRLLKDWNGSMSPDLYEPLLYAAYADSLRAQLIDDELGDNADDYRGTPVRVLNNLVSANTAWCDDVKTAHRESCETRVMAALISAFTTINDSQGRNRQDWRWGNSHIVSFAHPLLRFAGPLSRWFGPRISTGGGDHTVNRGTYRSMGEGRFPHVHGPGLRALFDMAKPEDARYMIAPGQSGKMNSPHFSDLAGPWAAGRYIVLKGDLEALRQTATAELTLVP